MIEAFQQGRPEVAWALTQELVALAKGLALEAAKARFLKNFGSEQCDNCDGLKAGPGVAATCFQVRQCYYTHIREGSSARQELVIDRLLGPKDRS